MWSRVPILVILGATGTGKSKLALQLATKFNGEIISADSMQVYKGLDIITNKVTKEEQQMAPHHLLNFLDPLQRYTVVDFRDAALPIIKRLHENKKLPIIVGGTHYYIESLLWKVLVEDIGSGLDYQIPNEHLSSELCVLLKYAELLADKYQEHDESCKKEIRAKESEIYKLILRIEDETGFKFPWKYETDSEITMKILRETAEEFRNNLSLLISEENKKIESALETCLNDLRILINKEFSSILKQLNLHEKKIFKKAEEETNLTLHNKLRTVDPEMASCLHPNNTRKILRSLQVFAQRGRPHSEILKDQRDQGGGSQLGGPLRFPKSIMFWIDADMEVLDRRLDERVDDMIERGLVKELLDFHNEYNRNRITNIDTSKAYTQGIFQSIGFKEFHAYLTLSDEERESEKGKQLLHQGIEDLKTVTKKYARKQKRWITNRFLKAGDREVPPVYSLDATDVSKWDEKVLEPAVAVVSKLLDLTWKGKVPDPLPKDKSSSNSSVGEHYCNVCQRIFIGDLQWKAHLSSRKHHRMEKKRTRKTDESTDPSSKKSKNNEEKTLLESS